MKESKLLCILASRENHASASRMDIGLQRWCNNVELKSDKNQAKIRTHASNDIEWGLVA